MPDGGNGFGRRARETFGAEARVVADQDAAAGLFRAHDVARDRVRHHAHVVEGEILGDHAAPAIRAEFNLAHGLEV